MTHSLMTSAINKTSSGKFMVMTRFISNTALALILLSAGTVNAQTSVTNTVTVTPPNGVTDPGPGPNSASDTDDVTPRIIRLRKTWVNAIANDAVSLTITGTVAGDIGSANPGNSTAPSTQSVAIANAKVGATINFTEAFTTGLAANYTSSLACVKDSDSSALAVTASGLTGSIVMPGDSDVTCTFTNAANTFGLSLTKVWTAAIANDAVSLNIAGAISTTAGSSTAPSTTTNATATASVGSTITLTEAFTTGSSANYSTSLLCQKTTDNSSVAVFGSGLSRTITMPSDSAVQCTYTNARPELTIVKTASSASFTVGVPASYTLMVTNTGSAATTGSVIITDTIPTGLTVGIVPSTCVAVGQVVTCATSLATGASESFIIPITPTASAANPSVNTATVSGGGDPTCPAASRCSSTVSTPVNPTVASVTPSTVTEGTNLVHTVTLSAITTQPVSYPFTLADGTAIAPGDYTNTPTFTNGVTLAGGVLTVPAGVTSFTVSYPTVVDALADSGETTTVSVGGVSATGTINDPLTDMVPNVSGLPITATIGVPYTGSYTCTNSGITQALGATCVIANLPPGLTSSCIPAQPAILAVGESITCAVTGLPTSTGVFVPVVSTGATNDGNPGNNIVSTTITIGVITVTIGNASTVEEGGLLVYAVNLSQASSTDTVITIALSGTSTAGIDYTSPTLTVTIPAGMVSVNVSVPSINDVQSEVTESVIITITAVTSGTVNLGATLVGTGNITDNDADLVPIANDDVTTFTEGGPVNSTVVSNDTPGNGTSIFNKITNPSNGSLVFNPDGSFTYTPNIGFVGNDSFVYQICDADTPTDCDTAIVTLTVLPKAGKLRLLKEVNPRQVSAGSIISYTLTVQNIGTLPVVGAQVLDTPPQGFNFVNGSVVIVDADNAGITSGTGPITFSGIDVPVGGSATIRYLLRVSAGLPSGEFINEATVFQSGVAISNTATAAVIMAGGSDPLFEQSRIWGKVWDDKNSDGWQDEGEKGIPGVRVATVEGWIAETDSKGRYHFEGIELSNQERGQNVVVKVDKFTIPEGSVFTTENPLLRRVTPAVPVRFDFGVKLPPPPPVQTHPAEEPEILPLPVVIDFGAVYFDTDKTTIKAEFSALLDKVAADIEDVKGGTIWIGGFADKRGTDEYNRDLALRRAKAVFTELSKRLSEEAKSNLKIEVKAAGAGQ